MSIARFTTEEIAARKGFIQSILIEHEQLLCVEQALEMRILAGGGAEAARLTMLIAPSGCGKTTTVKQAKARLEHKPEIAQHSLMPILYCSLPARCSIKTMTTTLLVALRDPLAERHGSAGMNSVRIIGQLRAQHVRLLILDEFQHLISSSGNSSSHRETTDWLKELLDGAGVPVVCVGLPEGLSLIATHDQIRRRTTKVIRMRPFEWDNGGPESRRFQAFLHVFEKEMQLPERSALGASEFAERIHIASGGLVGVVAQLVSEAMEVSMRRLDGPDSLTIGDFSEAYDGLPFDGQNPFDDRSDPRDIRAARDANFGDARARFGDALTAVHSRAGPRSKGKANALQR